MNANRTKKSSPRRSKAVTQERLIAARDRNLRQLLLRTTRTLSGSIEEGLIRRGYGDVRLAHSTFLAHLDLAGNSITQVAERAQMTKQAAGLLAEELEAMGYIIRGIDDRDARARVLTFTERGRKLLIETLSVIDEIESNYTSALGARTMDELRSCLQALQGLT